MNEWGECCWGDFVKWAMQTNPGDSQCGFRHMDERHSKGCHVCNAKDWACKSCRKELYTTQEQHAYWDYKMMRNEAVEKLHEDRHRTAGSGGGGGGGSNRGGLVLSPFSPPSNRDRSRSSAECSRLWLACASDEKIIRETRARGIHLHIKGATDEEIKDECRARGIRFKEY